MKLDSLSSQALNDFHHVLEQTLLLMIADIESATFYLNNRHSSIELYRNLALRAAPVAE